MKRFAKSLLVFAGLCFTLSGCSDRRANEADCRKIVHRIVELELEEMGFHDTALVEIRSEDLLRTYRYELPNCIGRPLSQAALACVAQAKTTEELSHSCLHR